MMHVGRYCLFFAGSYIRSRFFFDMIFTWNLEDMSLFECKRSDSVLYNVILITRGPIFFTPHFEGSVLVEGMCLNCLPMLTSFN